jgi:hypothetical protein
MVATSLNIDLHLSADACIAVCRIAQTIFQSAFRMVRSNQMMIPGAWEPRRRSAVAVNPASEVTLPPSPAATGGGSESRPHTQSAELPGWLKLSIFTATLLAAMWLAMTVFFQHPPPVVV